MLAGLGTIALLLGAAARLGGGVVLIGAALLAVAPLAIIYDTYFIQEAWFCFFTWALFFAALRWCGNGHGVGTDRWAVRECHAGAPSSRALPTSSRNPSLLGSILIGALAGLMQATKETSVIHFAALGVAWLATRFFVIGGTRPLDGFLEHTPGKTRPEAGFHLNAIHHVLTALVTAAFVYVLFYSAFFTHWIGVIDGVCTYFTYAARAAGSAHDQPWYYYFAMLWPHSLAGVHWGEPLLLLAALVGIICAFTPCAHSSHRALAVFTLTLLVLYSLIPYKTPWLLLTPYVGLTLLAGLGVTRLANGLPGQLARFAPAGFALVLVVACLWQNFPALGRYANDDRNSYVYQPTSADLLRLVSVIAALSAHQKIAIISPDHAWPLPWYLRNRALVGYFFTPPADLSAYDLVLYDSRLDVPLPDSVTAFGLRPNVILWSTSR